MLKVFSILAASLLLSGCSTATKIVTSPKIPIDKSKSCALMPLINDTNYYGADGTVSAAMETEIAKKGVCKLIEQSEIAYKLKNMGVEKERLFDKNYAISLASKLNVDYIFLGRVTEYNYQYGPREDPAVGLSVKLIDTKGQEVIWSADEGRVNRSFIFRDSLAATAIETVKSVLSDLK